MFPAVLQAQFTFSTNNGALTLTGYAGTDRVVTIPGTTNGLPVVSIGGHAFYRNSSLTSVTILASVINYAFDAFDTCTNLTAVFFQGNAPKDYAPGAPPVFSNVNKATLYYLQGTTGWSTPFDGLPAVQWDPQVLGQLVYATNNNVITVTGYIGPGGGVVIPSTIEGWPVAGVGNRAFWNCAVLSGITFPNTITNLGNLAFAGCTALTGVTIPNSASGSGAFSNCTSLANIVVPGNVVSLGEREFSGCTALTTITIPSSLTNIGDWAFQNCFSLNSVCFQGNAPVADSTVFDGSSNVTNYYLPKTAGWGATFAGRPTAPILFTCTTNSGAITIKSYIGIWGSVVVPDTLNGQPVTAIGNTAFYGCATLTNIIIGTNVTSIAGQALVGCTNLIAITVNALNPVYSSVDGVLFDKSRTTLLYCPGGRTGSYRIPDGVTSIPNYAFQWCPNLSTLTAPNTVTNIATLAFNVDPSLTAIFFEGNAPNAEWSAFLDIGSTLTVFYVPGTTGWETSFGGFLTAEWQPQVQTGDASFGVRTNQFGFNLTWADGRPVVVEACTDLTHPVWLPVKTNTLAGGSAYFSEPQWTNYSGRFYRLRSP